jgi:hypothetical protein
LKYPFRRINLIQDDPDIFRESAILPFELTLKVAHLTDADGTPILQHGFVNQGECAGYAKPLTT